MSASLDKPAARRVADICSLFKKWHPSPRFVCFPFGTLGNRHLIMPPRLAQRQYPDGRRKFQPAYNGSFAANFQEV